MKRQRVDLKTHVFPASCKQVHEHLKGSRIITENDATSDHKGKTSHEVISKATHNSSTFHNDFKYHILKALQVVHELHIGIY